VKHFIFIVSLFITISFAKDNINDELFDDFGDSDEVIITQTSTPKNSNFSADASVRLFSSYNYSHKQKNINDFRNLSSLKINVDAEMQYKFSDYKIKMNIKKSKNFIYDLKPNSYKIIPSGYDTYFDINKLYIQGSFSSNVDFKIGRQIVSWGKSDYIGIANILNPSDNREIGLNEVKDFKLGRAMSKFDYFKDNYTFSTIILMENRLSLLPQYGSDFAPPKKRLSPIEPKINIENMGLAFSLLGEFSSWDLALYGANLLYEKNKNQRTNMIAIAYNKAISQFLIKSEIAYFDYKKNKLDALLGLDYAISEGVIAIEIASKDEALFYTTRLSKKYLNQTLDMSLLFVGEGKNIGDNGILKIIADYKINDSWAINLGAIEYIGNTTPSFKMLSNNDRVFVNAKLNLGF